MLGLFENYSIHKTNTDILLKLSETIILDVKSRFDAILRAWELSETLHIYFTLKLYVKILIIFRAVSK